MDIKEKITKKYDKIRAEKPVTIAFLGDSVTHGCFEVIENPNRIDGIDCIYDQEAAYVNRFRKKFETLFPRCPLTVINAGVSGDSAVAAKSRLERDIILYSPDIAVVAYGLNDVLSRDVDAYTESLFEIFTQLKKADIIPVFMTENMFCTTGGLTPIKSLYNLSMECAEIQNNGTFDKFISKAKILCEKEKIDVCDCYSYWKKLDEYGENITFKLSNFINHPTRQMHEIFASKLIDTIVFK